MSTQLPLTLVAGLLAGAVGAVATNALVPPKAPASDARAASALNPNGELADQLRAVAAAQEEVLARLTKLESSASMGTPMTVRLPASAGNESIDLDAAVAAALAKLSTSPSGQVVTPDFRKQVETVLEIRAEEERLAREQERATREAAQLEDRLARLQTELGLDSRQVDGMRKVFLDADAKREELRVAMRDSRDGGGAADFEAMRTQWQALATSMDTQLSGVLTPAQYEQYKASNPDRGFGGRGGFGGDTGGGTNGGNTAGGNTGGRRRGGNGG